MKFNYFSIFRYASVTTKQGALIIGGTSNNDIALNTVACYNNSTWTKLDDLQTARYAHRAIVNGNKVYVIGGIGIQYVEIWSFDGESKNIKLAEPILVGYNAHPELLLVDTSFCVKP